MVTFLVWLLVVEVIGLAALPLTMLALPRLADRGIGLAKILGILVVTYLNYLLGSLFGQGNNAALLVLGLGAIFLVCVPLLGMRRAAIVTWLRGNRTAVILEEALFVVLFAAWALFRAAHPGILSAEKPMDLALMTASHQATSFPPYDPWLAGHTINYYYGGYLAMGTLVTLTGVGPAVGYNLALALLFALVGTGAYAAVYALTRDARWAILGPLFVLLAGNLDGLGQLLDPAHGVAAFDFFRSSRIVDPGPPVWRTITEFPAFSFLIGDLHAHVIALPFTLLAAGVALNLALAPAAGWVGLASTTARRVLVVAVAALVVGGLYFMNSWDWPTYTLLCGVALFVPGLRAPDRRRLGEAMGLAAGILALSYILYISFRRDFTPQYNSFGLRLHDSASGQVFTMFGLFLIPVAAMIVALVARPAAAPFTRSNPRPATTATTATTATAAGTAAPRADGARRAGASARAARVATVERPSPVVARGKADDDIPRLPTLSLPRPTSPGGRVALLLAAAVVTWAIAGLVLGLYTAGLLAMFAGTALLLAWRAARGGDAQAALALMLCAAGLGLIATCDVAYLRDNFCLPDGTGRCTGNLYRMNTVFKFYYQAWTLLALGAAYGLYALAGRLGRGARRFIAPAGAAALVAAGAVYTLVGVFTPATDTYTVPVAHAAPTLDGSAYLDHYHGVVDSAGGTAPDAAAIRWLRGHVTGHPTILEANEVQVSGNPPGPQDYWPFPNDPRPQLMMSRIATFTGLPTVLGWGYSHEGLWHGNGEVTTRFQDIHTMYTSPDVARVAALLRAYQVRYIYVGGVEAATYYGARPPVLAAALRRFERLGSVVYHAGAVTVVRVSTTVAPR